ncbi:MAG: NnrS family protein [Gammaproteobacteria bacterium]|nr:MAG: NnrS family protein [Gammaproteobacteria bacterium]
MDPNLPTRPVPKLALFELGFRPFFAGATFMSAALMLTWLNNFTLGHPMMLSGLSGPFWHGHEMVFGYALAVAAGFLLTAIRNWTNIQTLRRAPLAVIFLLWLGARIGFLINAPLGLVAAMDLLFLAGLTAAVFQPLLKARQWKNIGIASKIGLMLLANIVFYLGATGVIADGQRIGLFAGFYVILALIFTLGRRVMPFFIERGLDEPVVLPNKPWIDRSSLWLFLAFAIADIISPTHWTTLALAAALFIVHSIRFAGWYHPGIWKKPLLWVLMLGYGWMIAAFAIKILEAFVSLPPNLATHAFAIGAIGITTTGMMARISLGHSGRNIHQPPAIVAPVFLLLALAAVVRVVLPMLFAGQYMLWIGLSQGLWIAAFLLLFASYLPMWLKARADGRPG